LSDYYKIPTTREVWAVIHASHPNMEVFSIYSAPEGNSHGDLDQGVMETAYALKGCDFPIIEARSTWERNRVVKYERKNEKTEYWLCVAKKENDQ